MAGNSIGTTFKITTAGESHGPGNVVIIDGVPAGLKLSIDDIQPDLDRRRPGQSKIVTQRQEADQAEILSGVFEGRTTGTSLAVLIRNTDQRSKDYSNIKDNYRPGHADFTYNAKYGFRDYRGGGRASARETNVRVAAGAVAKKLLKQYWNVNILAYTQQVGDIIANINNPELITSSQIEANPVRCPDVNTAIKMEALIHKLHEEKDSIGGIAQIIATGLPAGWGEPVFDRLKADLAKALFSVPAVTGVEFGSGFAVATAKGSENNDCFNIADNHIITSTNNHGGILGGISSGMPILIRAAIKPTSSLPQTQNTVNTYKQKTTISTKGRHDPCLLPRFIPIAEAMVAITLADHALRQNAMQLH